MGKQTTEYLETLREAFPPGTEVRTILRHVSRSGMLRSISVIGLDRADTSYPLHDWSYAVGATVGSPIDRNNGGVRRTGAGMDMGFDLVYSLSRALYPDGFACIGDGCPSNDHSNYRGDDWAGEYGLEHVHSNGGYALTQRWL